MNHWAWGCAQQVQVFPICVWPKHKTQKVTSLRTSTVLTASQQGSRLCPSFVINARLSPSDSESMFSKRALTGGLGIRWPLQDSTGACAVIVRQWHWQSRISISILQSRARPFKLRHADKELEILLRYLDGTFLVCTKRLVCNLHVTVFAMCLVHDAFFLLWSNTDISSKKD